jgi:hypothetical protein
MPFKAGCVDFDETALDTVRIASESTDCGQMNFNVENLLV